MSDNGGAAETYVVVQVRHPIHIGGLIVIAFSKSIKAIDTIASSSCYTDRFSPDSLGSIKRVLRGVLDTSVGKKVAIGVVDEAWTTDTEVFRSRDAIDVRGFVSHRQPRER